MSAQLSYWHEGCDDCCCYVLLVDVHAHTTSHFMQSTHSIISKTMIVHKVSNISSKVLRLAVWVASARLILHQRCHQALPFRSWANVQVSLRLKQQANPCGLMTSPTQKTKSMKRLLMEMLDRLLSMSHDVCCRSMNIFCCKRPPWNEKQAHLTFPKFQSCLQLHF